MVAGIREGADARDSTAGQRARPRRPAARDAGVDRRKGDRPAGRAADHRGRLLQPSARSGWGCSAIRPSSTRWSALGRYTGNLTRADLQFDSPYNTYRYAGLPPGPIASPGRASLAAAAAPQDVPYLYFVSRNDGSHAFATTLDEHNRNVQQYQVKYFSEQAGRQKVNR